MATLGKAIALASDLFQDVTDKGGRPYIEHCLYVMERMRHLGDEGMIIGVLHDVLEDTHITAADLRGMKFSNTVIDGVLAMTKISGEDYEKDFIPRCRQNVYARIGKQYDIEHNSSVTRLKGVNEKDFDRLAKYVRSYRFLQAREVDTK